MNAYQFRWGIVLDNWQGFLAGAWPFGVVELVWSGIAARRWWAERSLTMPRRRR